MIALPPDAAPAVRKHKYDDQLAEMEYGGLYWFADPAEGNGVARAWRQRTNTACIVRRSSDAAGGVYVFPTGMPITHRKPRR